MPLQQADPCSGWGETSLDCSVTASPCAALEITHNLGTFPQIKPSQEAALPLGFICVSDNDPANAAVCVPVAFWCSRGGTLTCHPFVSKEVPSFVSCAALLKERIAVSLLKDLKEGIAMSPEPGNLLLSLVRGCLSSPNQKSEGRNLLCGLTPESSKQCKGDRGCLQRSLSDLSIWGAQGLVLSTPSDLLTGKKMCIFAIQQLHFFYGQGLSASSTLKLTLGQTLSSFGNVSQDSSR